MNRAAVIIINTLIGVISIASWLFMAVLSDGTAMLTAADFSSLKYFTVLSNLLNGAVCLVCAGWLLRGGRMTAALRTMKLISTSAVGLTFLTVMVFLGPLYGYVNMMRGSNLWLHLILPLLSFVSFILLERGTRISMRSALFAVIPTLLYEIGYLSNIFLHGKGTWPDTNDFYGFLNWGMGVGACIAVIMLLVTWLIAAALLAVSGLADPVSA